MVVKIFDKSTIERLLEGRDADVRLRLDVLAKSSPVAFNIYPNVVSNIARSYVMLDILCERGELPEIERATAQNELKESMKAITRSALIISSAPLAERLKEALK